MKIITDRARPLTDLRKSVPPHVAETVSKALEKLPADRFESARAFGDALGNPAFTTAATGASRTVSTPTRRGNPATWAAGIITIAALAGGWAFGRSTAPKPEAQPVQFVIELPDSITSVNRCCGPAQVLTPDGRTLVFVGMQGNQSGALYRRRLDQLEAEFIPGTEGASSPSFSPNGSWLLFEAGGTLKKAPMAGGPVVPVANTGTVSGATWADNDTIVYARNAENRLWRVPAAGGKPEKISMRDSTSSHMYPFALPGGRLVLVAIRRPGLALEESRIGIADLVTGDIDTLGFGTRSVFMDGSLIFAAADNTLLVQSLDLDGRQLAGSAVAILTRVSLSGGSNHEFAVSRNGLLTYEIARGSGSDVLRIVSASDVTVLPLPGRETGNVEDPAISPDGRRVILRLAGTQSDDLWMLDRSQGTLNRFTVGGGQSPTWSPDGKRIAYYAPASDSTEPGLYVRTVDQSQRPQLVFRGANTFPGSWTSDGRSLVFNTNRGTNLTSGYDIGIVTMGDTTPRWVVSTEFNERQPQASSDGRYIAYTSNRSGRSEVYVQTLEGDGAPFQVSVDGASSPRWSREGRTLYYTSANRIIAAVFAAGPGLNVQRRTLVNGSINFSIDVNAQNTNWDVFPDGKVLVIDIGGGDGQRRVALIQNWPALARSMGAKQ
jgi:serine/threonine-protein kinase